MSRQYINAAKVLEAVASGTSLKAYCSRAKVGKREFALVCETLKYQSLLHDIYQRSGVDISSINVNPHLLCVMTYELLFGAGKIQGGGVVKRLLMDHLPELQGHLKHIMSSRKVTHPSELLSKEIVDAASLPRHVRINLLKTTLHSGVDMIRTSYSTFHIDEHIPSLVVLPPDVRSLHDAPFIADHSVIIQDKASCFPSFILGAYHLSTPRAGDIIDACASPGNKTSHMAAILHEAGARHQIFAFDKSYRRYHTLAQRMEAAGTYNITPQHGDFLAIDTSQYTSVTSILCDPSCSGSGVVRTLERVAQQEDVSTERLKALQTFQIDVVKKALSFPSVTAVVYSTCSVHQIENEDVVAEVLRQSPDWQVIEPPNMVAWKRRGVPGSALSEQQQHCVIRCMPEDGMNGFFVALFVKTHSNHMHSQDAIVNEISEVSKTGSNNEEVDIVESKISGRKRRRSHCGKWWKPLSGNKFLC